MLRKIAVSVLALMSWSCTHSSKSIDGVRDLSQNIAWRECSSVSPKPGELATLKVRFPSYPRVANGTGISIRLSDVDGNVVHLLEHVTQREVAISETAKRVIVTVLTDNRNSGQLTVDLAANCINYAYFTLAEPRTTSH